MPKKQKRDNAYYIRRLENEYPSIHADYVAGKYRSPRSALEAAGLRRRTSPLSLLKSAWAKASSADRAAFLRGIGGAPSIPHEPGTAPIAVGQRLTPEAKSRIRWIMDARKLSMGDVMDELGMKRLNASLGSALLRNHKISPTMITALEEWLKRHA